MSNKLFSPNEHLRDSDGTLMLGFLLRRSILQTALNVSTSAIPVPATPLSKRLSVVIFNNSDNIVYLGNSSVTTSDGFPLYPRQSIGINIEDSVVIYAISTTTSELRVLEGS